MLQRWGLGRRIAVGFAALAATAMLAAPGQAKEGKPEKARKTPPVREAKVIQGEEASREVADLVREIKWQRSVEEALKEAKSKGRLVLWAHVLGALDGDT